ncbi:MAG: alpha/beta fold hydrolase [Candidatus Hydrogenedens sp.]|jgi:alpha-beta hydrolase superfamily lysophospholipase|nr:alpha/beta fold hydrolase [Candidatus Hydrogenedens sp.]
MISALVTVVVVSGIVLLISLYMTLLSSLYPEQLRTNEVLHLRTDDLWILRLCRYRKSRASGEPVLFVHGMRSNQHNFTNPENGCLVDYLSNKGYDCWTIDLRGCVSSQAPFERTRNEVRMEDYFQEDLPAAIRHILKTTNYSKLHWVGHSMGGILLHAYVDTHGSEQLASATTLGTPFDFNDAGRTIPRWIMNFGIKFPAFAGGFISGIIPLFRLLRITPPILPVNRRNIPRRMHAGHFINMLEHPLPGVIRQVQQWMDTQKFLLCDGEVDIKKSLPTFPVPLLAFYGGADPFVDHRRAMQLFETITLEDKDVVLCARSQGFSEDYSHCDLVFGKEADTEIFEPIARWLSEHSFAKTQENGADPQHIAAAVVSPEKRAHMLSGAAYSHLKDSSPVVEPPQKKTTKEDIPPSTAPTKTETADPPTRRVSRVVVPKADTVKKETRDKAQKPAVSEALATPPVEKESHKEEKAAAETPKVSKKEKSTGTEKPQKKVAPRKQVDVRPATVKARKAKSKPKQAAPSAPVVPGGLEISPEVLARAEAIRAARNESFSQLISDLNTEEPEEKKEG